MLDTDGALGHALAGDAQHFGGGRRDIENAAGHERTTIVDPDHHRMRANGHLDMGAKWKVFMGGGQLVPIEVLSVRGPMTVEANSVPRTIARLGRCRKCRTINLE